jgi:hypothetical protein
MHGCSDTVPRSDPAGGQGYRLRSSALLVASSLPSPSSSSAGPFDAFGIRYANSTP